MCELFAISSSKETEISFSLDEFSKHGGLTDHHKHGWGVAYYQENAVKIIKEAHQASNSLCLDFIKNYRLKSQIIMSHIRYATQGQVSYRNTQPFTRELAGREHVFIHNGDLGGIVANPKYQSHRFLPLGETDSEAAFCYLMTQMAAIWDAPQVPTFEQRFQVFNYFAVEMQSLGLANFIYSDSEYVYVFSDKREVKDKNNSNKLVTLPGLHVLKRSCQNKSTQEKIQGLNLTHEASKKVVLISSVPLNDEDWVPLTTGQSLVFKAGEVVFSVGG